MCKWRIAKTFEGTRTHFYRGISNGVAVVWSSGPYYGQLLSVFAMELTVNLIDEIYCKWQNYSFALKKGASEAYSNNNSF